MDKPSKMAHIGFLNQLSEWALAISHQQHSSPDLEAELSSGREYGSAWSQGCFTTPLSICFFTSYKMEQRPPPSLGPVGRFQLGHCIPQPLGQD